MNKADIEAIKIPPVQYIRYGVSTGKLYENYEVLDNNSLTIHSLNKRQKYYFVVHVFNENGITKGKDVVIVGD